MNGPASGDARKPALLWLLAPLLFVLAPMASFYAANADELRPADMLPSTGLGILGVVLVTALILGLSRKTWIAALWASVLTAVFFYWGAAYDAIGPLHLRMGPLAVSTNRVLAGAVVLIVFALAFISRNQRRVESAVRAVTILGVCFAVGAAVSLVFARASVDGLAAKQIAATAAGKPSAGPAPIGTPKARDDLPDIYFVVLDAYTSNEALDEFAGFDNSAFTESLRRKGFYVAEDSKSNYSATFLSLASTLNMDYVNDRVKGIAGADRSVPYAMIMDNRVTRVLKERGYTYVHVASGWAVTDRAPKADYFHAAGQNELTMVLQQTTMLRLVANRLMTDGKRETVKGAFAYLESCGKIEGPKFVFAHILVPHGPFVFDANGGLVRGSVSDMKSSDKRSRAYVEQLKATNSMALRFVDGLLRDRVRPTVVVIQGDHGTRFMTAKDLDPTTAKYRRRHSILNAMYFSEGQPTQLYPSISSVNTFRVVLDHALGTDYPLLEDRSYYSRNDYHPYDLIDVTDVVK